MLLLATVGWLGALAAATGSLRVVAGSAVGLGLAGALLWRLRGARPGLTALACLVVFLAVATAAGVRATRVADNPIAQGARLRAEATLDGRVTSDPRVLEGAFADEVMVRIVVSRMTTQGSVIRLRQPVVVFAGVDWLDVPLGASVRVAGHLAPTDRPDVAATLSTHDPPEVTAPPDVWWRASGRVRAALRQSVSHLPADRRALVPALVDGDDAGLDPTLEEDFRTTGLTHLMAVSGTNLTLVVGFALVVARWLRVRGRWLYVVGAFGIVGFVLVARTEPSVLRAAVMGTVALIGMGANGRDRGMRALGVATVVLLVLDPGLATAAGFALSVIATAGILLLAPGWRDALARWLPRWLAEAIAVPTAAQLATTPLIAAISGQVSLVAVLANLLVAPVVGPATVLGLLGGLLTLLMPLLGALAGTGAGWCVAWIIAVARHLAGLPMPSVGWGTGPLALVGLVVVCVVVAVAGPWLMRRRAWALVSCVALLATMVVRLPTPGWPPDGWVMAMCDVGQGDGLVLNTGRPHTAIVVDAGPDPRAMDDCLSGLGVTRIPLVVLTHFHADHIDGLPGVVDGRRIEALETSRLQDPPDAVSTVRQIAAPLGVTPVAAPYAVTRRIGDVTLEPVWPQPSSPTLGPGDGSTANNASVVLLARIRGVTLLLCGDIEPEGQSVLATLLPGVHVDVLKVPHHGSRYQNLDFLRSLQARVAVISVGADNDYGHPAPDTVEALEAAGATVLRTDRDGSIAVAAKDHRLFTRTHG